MKVAALPARSGAQIQNVSSESYGSSSRSLFRISIPEEAVRIPSVWHTSLTYSARGLCRRQLLHKGNLSSGLPKLANSHQLEP
jgi:hypothetical protein